MNSKDLLQEHLKDNTYSLPKERDYYYINSMQIT